MTTNQLIALYIGTALLAIPSGFCFGRIPWVILSTTLKPKLICLFGALAPFFFLARSSDQLGINLMIPYLMVAALTATADFTYGCLTGKTVQSAVKDYDKDSDSII